MSNATTTDAAVAQTARASIALEGDFLRPHVIDLLAGDHANASADPFDLRCFTTNRFIRTVDAYRGVLLKDLIMKAGLRPLPAGEFKRTVFIAQAHDGYAVVFSWHELFNTPIGERAIVATECGDAALSPEDGAPILFSGADILPAPRHVKRLARVIARVIVA
jgi:hypothetical protein